MKISFAKFVASGNDFVIVDNRKKAIEDKVKNLSDFAKFASRRIYSVGADGVLVLENSEKADFKMRIFNPDGSEVTMCGNGIRSSALYAFTKKWCGSFMKIETGAGILEVELRNGSIMTKMTPSEDIKLGERIEIEEGALELHIINTGVPHAVHFVEDIKNYDVKNIGAKIRYHKRFTPLGTNADFVEITDSQKIFVRTYERGVEDETLACGTGVVASAIISHLVKGVKEPVDAVTKSGDILRVRFTKEGNVFKDVYLEGRAYIAFEGTVDYV